MTKLSKEEAARHQEAEKLLGKRRSHHLGARVRFSLMIAKHQRVANEPCRQQSE
jgi:hypothetical protein